MLLSATTAGKSPKDQFDFFPLTVDVGRAHVCGWTNPRFVLPP